MFSPSFHPVNFLLLQSGKIELTSCCFTPQDFACSSCCFFIRQGLDPILDNSAVTQSGQIQGDGLACWSIWNSARISILMLHWVMVIRCETSMVSARIQPVSRIWNSARTSVQEFGHTGEISLSLTLRRSVQRRFDLNPDSVWLPSFASVSTV